MSGKKNNIVMKDRGLVVDIVNFDKQIILSKQQLGYLSRPCKLIAVDVVYNQKNTSTNSNMVMFNLRKPTIQEYNKYNNNVQKHNSQNKSTRLYHVAYDGRARVQIPNTEI